MAERFYFEAVADELLDESLALNPGCCRTDAWRGRLCPYHEGFRDGMDALMERFAAWLPKDADA